jgi:DNA-binding NtrC family response regulator
MDNIVRIVIADDDDLCKGLIRDSIEMNSIEVFEASDGLEALSIIKTNDIDVLITDLNMPKMDGLTLINQARLFSPNMVSIIITGFGSLESAIKAIQQGAYDYVQKPFSIERISVVARNAVERIRTLKEKSKLLKELEGAYQSLKSLEARSRALESLSSARCDESAPKDGFFVLSQPGLPLFCYESSPHSSTRLLAQLERLTELRREGAVTDSEFEALKKHLIKPLGSMSS